MAKRTSLLNSGNNGCRLETLEELNHEGHNSTNSFLHYTSSTQPKQQNNGASRLSSSSLTFIRTNHVYSPLLVILLGCFCFGCSIAAAKQECQGIIGILPFVYTLDHLTGRKLSDYIELVFIQSTGNISFRRRKA